MEARELKFAIFKDLCGTRELGRWKRYWGAFQKYMRLQLSLGELHAVVASELSPRQRRLHNRLVVLLLSRAHASAAAAKGSVIQAAPSNIDDLADPPTHPTTADRLVETHEQAMAQLLGIMVNEPASGDHYVQATADLSFLADLACPSPRPSPTYDAAPAPMALASNDAAMAGYRLHAPSGGLIYSASIPPYAEGPPVEHKAIPLELIMQQAALQAGLHRVEPGAMTAFASAVESYMEDVTDALLSHIASSNDSPLRRIAPEHLVAATISHPQLMHPTAPVVRERAISALENRF